MALIDEIILHFATKRLDKDGKLKLPNTISRALQKNILETAEPLHQILAVFQATNEATQKIYKEKAIIRAFLPMISHLVGMDPLDEIDPSSAEIIMERGQTVETREKFVFEYLDLLKTSKISSGSVTIAFLLKIPFDCPDGMNRDATLSLLGKLWIDANIDEYCTLISHHSLYHLIDLDKILLALVVLNKPANIAVLIGDRKIIFLKLIEDEVEIAMRIQQKFKREMRMGLLGKVAKSCIKIWALTLDVAEFPRVKIAMTISELMWAIRNARDVENVGNPNFDFLEIQGCYVDRVFDLVNRTPASLTEGICPQEYLRDYAGKDIRALGLHLGRRKDRVGVSELKSRFSAEKMKDLDYDNNYYSPKAPILLIDSTNGKETSDLEPHLIDSIAIDCEWSSAPLATTQLCVDFVDGRRVSYILDMLDPPLLLHKTLFELYKNTAWVGFCPEQDFRKIAERLPALTLSRPTNLLDLAKLDLGPKCASLAAYSTKLLGKELDKRPRMGLWEKRPLLRSQVLYAAGDVEILLDLKKILSKMSKNKMN